VAELYWRRVEARTRLEPDICFWSPSLSPKTRFHELFKICAIAGFWWRSKVNITKNLQVLVFHWRFNNRDIPSTLTGCKSGFRRYEKSLWAGSKSARNILVRLSPYPARFKSILRCGLLMKKQQRDSHSFPGSTYKNKGSVTVEKLFFSAPVAETLQIWLV